MWRSAVQVCLGLPWKSVDVERRTSVGKHARYGGLAQLARAPALQAGGQRFESVILHFPPNAEEIFDILRQDKTVA